MVKYVIKLPAGAHEKSVLFSWAPATTHASTLLEVILGFANLINITERKLFIVNGTFSVRFPGSER